MFKTSTIVSLIASFILFATSVYALTRESVVFLGGGVSQQSRFDNIFADDLIAGLSTYATELALRDCDEALKSDYSRAQESERRIQVMRNCLGFAIKATKSNPANGLAWFIAAQASAWIGDYPAMNTYLQQSQSVMPYRATLAAGRTFMMLSVEPQLDDQTRIALQRDILALADSRYGLEKLAKFYAVFRAERPLLTQMMEPLPGTAKRQFLKKVGTHLDG